MLDFFFYLFSALTLASAALVVVNRNAVNAAMFLILTFLGMACLFVLLQSYFLAVLQVLVYAGAVVVLFLFIVMLLDVRGGERKRFKPLTLAAGCISAVLLVFGVFSLTASQHIAQPALSSGPATGSSLKAFGLELFTTYLLPMQVTGFLLLIAMIGVIVISKNFPPRPTSEGK